MVVVALLSVDLVESVDLVSVELVVNCISKTLSNFERLYLWKMYISKVFSRILYLRIFLVDELTIRMSDLVVLHYLKWYNQLLATYDMKFLLFKLASNWNIWYSISRLMMWEQVGNMRWYFKDKHVNFCQLKQHPPMEKICRPLSLVPRMYIFCKWLHQ